MRYTVLISGEERKYSANINASGAKEALIIHIKRLNKSYSDEYLRKNIIKVTSEDIDMYFYQGYLLAEVRDNKTMKISWYALSGIKVDSF